MKKILTVCLLALVVAMSMGGVASATHPGEHAGETIPTGITTGQGFIDVLEAITDWVFVILLIIAVIFIVLAGLQFITGGGRSGSGIPSQNQINLGSSRSWSCCIGSRITRSSEGDYWGVKSVSLKPALRPPKADRGWFFCYGFCGINSEYADMASKRANRANKRA